MKFIAEINVMPLKALLDPQGKAVTSVIHNTGFADIDQVRVGKHITLEIEAADKAEAERRIDEVCRKVLHNPIMEGYEFTVS
ncbi:MAG: phosphoribosylformylglycinamidine synthase subunit PurS [Prevotellaceae bacterium]|jgi:phosphoribosylformylglycinamidine synthase|nr:phosphoribosylformylglycinamidine synthase subunit PurS [Prevotellaceae bacterium]MDR2448483.1 phosphoribosylformylglycinamidine synthase subunit PurS [Prevotellaceae bacterium]